jgi:hypothetical protein
MIKGAFSMTENRTVEILYGVLFAVHVCVCFYIANARPFPWLMDIAIYMISMYGKIGFRWSQNVAYFLSAGIMFGMLLNVVRRAAEGMLLGWPRFKNHDRHTFFKFWLRCIFFVGFVFLGIGAHGSNASRNFEKLHTLDAGYGFGGGIMDIFIIAIFSFLFGAVVNVIDDAISATISLLKE